MFDICLNNATSLFEQRHLHNTPYEERVSWGYVGKKLKCFSHTYFGTLIPRCDPMCKVKLATLTSQIACTRVSARI